MEIIGLKFELSKHPNQRVQCHPVSMCNEAQSHPMILIE